MENALDTMDDTEFSLKHSSEPGRIIRVKRYNKEKSRSRSRDNRDINRRSRSRSRSKSNDDR